MRTHRHKHNGHTLNADLEKIKSAIADTALDLKERTGEAFSDSLDNLKERSNRVHHDVASYTAKRPIKSLGVALLVGLALGFFIRK